MKEIRNNSVALDYLIMKIGNYDCSLIKTFMEDIKKAKEMEEAALQFAFETGVLVQAQK